MSKRSVHQQNKYLIAWEDWADWGESSHPQLSERAGAKMAIVLHEARGEKKAGVCEVGRRVAQHEITLGCDGSSSSSSKYLSDWEAWSADWGDSED